MNWILEKKTVDSLFTIKSGDFHATKELEVGNVPLISCGDTDNGLVGYFDIPDDKRYQHCLTVAYNGQPLLAKFHPYEFGAKDDVAVLKPRTPMLDSTLFYLATLFNLMKWRYSFGRKCFRNKLSNITIQVPITEKENGEKKIDQDAISTHISGDYHRLLPPKGKRGPLPLSIFQWKNIDINELFSIKRGDFHSLSSLASGVHRTISRTSADNGTVGFFEIPDKADIYPRSRITISTVGGDAFVQLSDFIATDNVLILSPKQTLCIETLFFIAFSLNRQRWRYSYGRQCYKTKFEATAKIWLPVNDDTELDEKSIKSFIHNTTYWNQLKETFTV
jgi:hypothetical protein